MKRLLAWAVPGLALLCGCRQELPAKLQTGEDLYMANCAVCHNTRGEGLMMYPALAHSQWVDGPPERLAAIILDGMQRGSDSDVAGVMPSWKTLSDVQIAAVMSYLRQRDGKPPASSVEVSRVRLETQARNSYWTAGDLRTLKIH
ncbi:MAG TPA: cytochrome c [Chthoniobacteraceae bacterium]|jgi:mono/diheme cytochrome c family protein|nr:cytochrome c [Chthoniobacteraceae bacterium]